LDAGDDRFFSKGGQSPLPVTFGPRSAMQGSPTSSTDSDQISDDTFLGRAVTFFRCVREEQQATLTRSKASVVDSCGFDREVEVHRLSPREIPAHHGRGALAGLPTRPVGAGRASPNSRSALSGCVEPRVARAAGTSSRIEPDLDGIALGGGVCLIRAWVSCLFPFGGPPMRVRKVALKIATRRGSALVLGYVDEV